MMTVGPEVGTAGGGLITPSIVAIAATTGSTTDAIATDTAYVALKG